VVAQREMAVIGLEVLLLFLAVAVLCKWPVVFKSVEVFIWLVWMVQRWAVDLNEYACISMKHNHPETKVNPHSRTLSSQCFYVVLLDLFGTA
jgi:hypothetical protein